MDKILSDYISYFLPVDRVKPKDQIKLNGTTDKLRTKKIKRDHPALVLGNVGLVYSLTKAGIPVYVGAELKKNPSFYSRYAKNKILFSTYSGITFINELIDFGKKLKNKAVIFSDDDDALLTISKYRHLLSDYFYFQFPDHERVQKILDKQQFSSLCQQYDLPAPATFNISNFDELKKYSQYCTYPCIIKPVYRSDWYDDDFEQKVGCYKKAYKCTDQEQLFAMYKKVSCINTKVVLQEYIEGDDSLHYSVNMYIDNNGDVKGSYIAKKLRMYPIGAGMGSFIVTIQDEEVTKAATKVAQALNLRGLLNIQFKRDSRTMKPKLIEIHFRNSVWGYIGVAADINLYEKYYQGLVGEKITSQENYKNEVKYVDLNKDIAGFFQYRAAGELSFMKWLNTFRGKLVVGDFKMKDPVPFMVICWVAVMTQFKSLLRKS